MGLREVFKKGAQTITKAFGNVAVAVTYTDKGERVAGVLQSDTEYPNKDMFISKFNIERPSRVEQKFNVLPTDLKGLIPVDDLGLKPKSGDEVEITSSSSDTLFAGDKFRVEGFATDPAEALFTLHLRPIR